MVEIVRLEEKNKEEFVKGLLDRTRPDFSEVDVIVKDILEEVEKNGDSALFKYTKKFDNVDIDENNICVSREEVERAYDKVDDKVIAAIKKASDNIMAFHKKQARESWYCQEEGMRLGQKYTPIEIAAVYVPGGTASYPSSVLMNVIPAKVAGVSEIYMLTPPSKTGEINPAVLVAADIVGIDKIFKVGGAQAIGAAAYGTESIKKADKITGPGNIFVASAKKNVYGICDIDMIAGPSEIVILADAFSNPKFLAADMMSQAEHDVLASSVLVTTDESIAVETKKEIERQIEYLSRKEIIEESLRNNASIILVGDIKEAIDMVNTLAPEHLELCVEEPFEILDDIKNAGAIFMGNYSPEPLGDYFAGPNHVLPTSGTARFFSPLGVDDFVKKSSVISYTREALENVSEDIVHFANEEQLDAHANSIKVRFEGK